MPFAPAPSLPCSHAPGAAIPRGGPHSQRRASRAPGRLRLAGVWACGLAATLLLGGCASVIRLDHEVQSYPAWGTGPTPQAGQTYRFQRLPSQQAGSDAREALETAVAARLAAAGLQAAASDDAPPQWRVEVSARSLRFPHAPWDDPWERTVFLRHGTVATPHGRWVRVPVFPAPTPPYYQREVQVVLRDALQGRTVYESRAAHDGPWGDGPGVWTALVNAAMDGFPNPPTAPRRVVIEIPR